VAPEVGLKLDQVGLEVLGRARKGLAPIVARWEAEEGGRELRFDDWIERLEAPSHFRVLLGYEKLKEPRSMSAVQVSDVLDDLTFPTLMATVVAGASGIAAHHLHGGRELMNELAAEFGGTSHPKRILWLTDTFFDANGVSSALQSVLAEARRRDLPLDFLICHEDQAPEAHLHVVRPLEAFTLPGFTHDVCSAVYPLGIASPFFRRLPLAAHGSTMMPFELNLDPSPRLSFSITSSILYLAPGRYALWAVSEGGLATMPTRTFFGAPRWQPVQSQPRSRGEPVK